MNFTLFNDDLLKIFLRDRLTRLREHIEGIHSDKSFEGNLERLVKESEKKFWLKIPELLENSYSVGASH